MPIIHIPGVFASNLDLVGTLISLPKLGVSHSPAKTRPKYLQNIIFCFQSVSACQHYWFQLHHGEKTTQVTLGKSCFLNLETGSHQERWNHRKVWFFWLNRCESSLTLQGGLCYCIAPHQLPSCACLLLLLPHLPSFKAGWVQGWEPGEPALTSALIGLCQSSFLFFLGAPRQ